ncbi:MAG TPA: NADH-quinone oxidoreductase subunit L [bacterium (Candidatus Stahlbacteria)]|nr:NADH-quinone oxidoreductase subunit L [Candidatus Stahlbacteria bacterium]
MIMLLLVILLPFIFGGISLILPRRTKKLKGTLAVTVTLTCLVLSIFVLRAHNIAYVKEWMPSLGIDFSLRAYTFSAFILLFINLFGLLISLYSIRFMQGRERLSEYYGYLLFTIGASAGAVLANNLILFLVFWGIVLLTLYGLLSLGSYKVATKGASIIGFSDFCLILGIIFLWRVTHTFGMSEINKVPLNSGLAIGAFVLMMIGAIAKAGAMPFHTWIPDAAEKVPVPVMALLPASLDKLLGIYFLSRICMDFFKFTPNSVLSIILMLIGSVTIVVAVLMALVQHNIIKLLSYHAVSQVGYMVLGIGTAIPLGIAGGIFHMLNHSIYKACLFLAGGSAKKIAGTPEIDKMGGLSGILPITFVTGLIAALSISGVPPFNGFFSKWMVYQGVIEAGTSGHGWISNLWIVWLTAAMFGSALTLASFMKFIHGTFLGQTRVPSAAAPKRINENFSMATPMIILAGLCVAFGIFACAIPLNLFISPTVGKGFSFLGFWSPTLATLLIIIGIVIGGVIYLVSRVRPVRGLVREDTSFIGGESIEVGEVLPPDGGEPIATMRVSGVEFYDTIKDYEGLKGLYDRALRGVYDFYNWGIRFSKGVAYFVWTLGDRLADRLWSVAYKLVLGVSESLRKTHTGILTTYLLWISIGLVVLLLVLLH